MTHDDALAPARGIFFGAIIGMAMWAIIIAAFCAG